MRRGGLFFTDINQSKKIGLVQARSPSLWVMRT
jgi:hypothetical protein